MELSDLHFRLSDHPVLQWGPPRIEVGGVYLWAVDVAITPILDPIGEKLGFFLGFPIDYANGTVITDRVIYPGEETPNPRSIETLETWLFGFGGRWIAVIATERTKRVYVDANATFGVVVDRDNRIAGSAASVLLSPTDYIARLRRALLRKLDVARVGWFMSGLTAHEGIDRILPNHYLDLDDWSTRRHWPGTHSIQPSCDVNESLKRLSTIVSQHIRTLASHGSVVCALTGGYETRFLLACSRPIGGIDYVTVEFSGAAEDVYIASMLAAKKNLKHAVLPVRVATREEASRWFLDCGHCVGGPLSREHPSVAPLADYDFFVGGLGGEVARGFFYRSNDTGEESISARSLVARAGLPLDPIVVEATDTWLRSAPELSLRQLLDLAYVELRMGPWGFGAAYTKHYTNEIHPMICRESYELMFGLPPECKKANPLLRTIDMLDSTLLSIPINRYGDFRDQLSVLVKLTQPKRVAKKLRKLFG